MKMDYGIGVASYFIDFHHGHRLAELSTFPHLDVNHLHKVTASISPLRFLLVCLIGMRHSIFNTTHQGSNRGSSSIGYTTALAFN